MMVSKHIIPWWFKKLLGVQVEAPASGQVDGPLVDFWLLSTSVGPHTLVISFLPPGTWHSTCQGQVLQKYLLREFKRS